MAVVNPVPARIKRSSSLIFVGDVGGEIEEEVNSVVVDETIYVAVSKDVKESKLNLIWAIQNSRGKRICILFVHVPATMIPLTLMGAKFSVSSSDEQEVRAYREIERQNMHKTLDEYLCICRWMGVRAEKLHIEMDSIEKGIVELISQYGIQKLIMGAASDKHYSKKMMDLKSKKAIYVCEQAPASCHVQFICKGHLIYTRKGTEVSSDESDRQSMMSPFGSTTPSDTAVEPAMTPDLVRETESSENALELTLSFSCLTKEEIHHSSPPSVLDGGMNETLYDQLEQAMVEAHYATRHAYQETFRREKAEKDALEAIQRAKISESLLSEEMNLRKMAEEELKKEKEELENMTSLRDKVKVELLHALDQLLSLESQLSSAELMINELEQKIISDVDLLQSYKNERDELQMQHDNLLREAEELKRKQGDASHTHVPQLFSEFSLSEIEKATSNFNPSLKIREGGYESIFKGVLRHTEVAIKMLHANSMQGSLEFQQEVDVLSKLRHPNLITLIGACPESWSLVYEYLPNGSLEDRLACKDNTPPLSWQTRVCIAAELCSALIFLHSCKPHSIVHGDLKPSNIILDANLVSKLSNFGICHILSNYEGPFDNTAQVWRTDPKETFVYMDPEFPASGELTPKSDVYSFGIILLRLLTGRPDLGITKEVKYAVDTGKLSPLLDPLAGDWPFVQAEQLARLALRCCEMNRKSRPNLYSDVWRVLDAMRASSGGPNSFGLSSDGPHQPPSYFICPIFLEVMHDPQVAADGFTYEAEAIRGWLNSGRGASPMTNSKLAHQSLVPNRVLRAAIQDWLQSH